MNLAVLWSADRGDMDKSISSHRWLLEICSHHEVTAKYVIQLSFNFNRHDKFEYAMEVLEGSMDMMKTLEDEVLAETNLIFAYIGCGEFLKAKATHKKCCSTDICHWVAWMQSVRIEGVTIKLQSLISEKWLLSFESNNMRSCVKLDLVALWC